MTYIVGISSECWLFFIMLCYFLCIREERFMQPLGSNCFICLSLSWKRKRLTRCLSSMLHPVMGRTGPPSILSSWFSKWKPRLRVLMLSLFLFMVLPSPNYLMCVLLHVTTIIWLVGNFYLVLYLFRVGFLLFFHWFLCVCVCWLNLPPDVIGVITWISGERAYIRDGRITKMVVVELTDERFAYVIF